jgi:hypothetical protein
MEKKKFFDHTGSIPFVICNVLWVVASVVNIYADMHNVFSYHEHYTFGDALRTVRDCWVICMIFWAVWYFILKFFDHPRY